MWYVENNLFFNEPPYPHMKTFEIVQALKLKLIEALLQGHVFLGMVLRHAYRIFILEVRSKKVLFDSISVKGNHIDSE